MNVKKDLSLRREAFRLYCTTGNVAEVARQLNLKRHQIYRWALADNWADKRAELRRRLQVHSEIMQKAEESVIVKLCLSEMDFLDYLQGLISESIIEGGIRPKTWKDLIMTQKFILERREKIVGIFTNPPDKSVSLGTPLPKVERIEEGNPSSSTPEAIPPGELKKHLDASTNK